MPVLVIAKKVFQYWSNVYMRERKKIHTNREREREREREMLCQQSETKTGGGKTKL